MAAVIDSITPDPADGPLSYYSYVVLTGSGFSGVFEVAYAAPPFGYGMGFTIDSDSQMTLHINISTSAPLNLDPGVTVGPYDITLRTGGSEFTHITGVSIYRPLTLVFDAITGGPFENGDTVTLHGSGFTDVTSVLRDNSTPMDYEIFSDTEISVVVTGSPGSYFIYLHNAETSVNRSYTITAPVITSSDPATGTLFVGDQLVLTGHHFAHVISVGYFGVHSVPLPYTIDSETQITVSISGDQLTSALDEFGTLSGGYFLGSSGPNSNHWNGFSIAYPPPVIDSVEPSSAQQGSIIGITGSRFTGATSVFSDFQFEFVVDSDSQITATVPNIGTFTSDTSLLYVVTLDGTSNGVWFTIEAAPEQGGGGGGNPDDPTPVLRGRPGDQVTVPGSGFADVTSVQLTRGPDLPAVEFDTFGIDSDEQITVTVPDHEQTSGLLTVTSPSGTSTAAYFSIDPSEFDWAAVPTVEEIYTGYNALMNAGPVDPEDDDERWWWSI